MPGGHLSAQLLTRTTERVKDCARVLTSAFTDDPTITWILNSMSREERIAYLPKFFTAVCAAGALNGGTFEEIGDWKSCGILLPPGSDVGNLATLLPAGLPSVFWSIGFQGCKVCDLMSLFVGWLSSTDIV